MFRLIISGPAEQDMQAAHDWWAQNRSKEQANRWYLGIHEAITSLVQMPERCSFATERDLLKQGIRQLLYGLGHRPTHRVVFVIDGNNVIVLRVRHTAQDALTSKDLL